VAETGTPRRLRTDNGAGIPPRNLRNTAEIRR
jgi:hypothetical protein